MLDTGLWLSWYLCCCHIGCLMCVHLCDVGRPEELKHAWCRQGTSLQYQNSYLDLAVWYSILKYLSTQWKYQQILRRQCNMIAYLHWSGHKYVLQNIAGFAHFIVYNVLWFCKISEIMFCKITSFAKYLRLCPLYSLWCSMVLQNIGNNV